MATVLFADTPWQRGNSRGFTHKKVSSQQHFLSQETETFLSGIPICKIHPKNQGVKHIIWSSGSCSACPPVIFPTDAWGTHGLTDAFPTPVASTHVQLSVQSSLLCLRTGFLLGIATRICIKGVMGLRHSQCLFWIPGQRSCQSMIFLASSLMRLMPFWAPGSSC